MVVAVLALSGCGYNDFQRLDEQTKAAWSEVLNQYQRRADLVPNIVATVKGEAAFEQDTLTKVVEARAKATSIQVTPETLNNPEAFKKFQQAQGELGSALSRLMVVSERYPDLKANQGFRAGPQLPEQPDCHGVRLPAQTELRGAERSADFGPTGGGFREKVR